MLSQIFKNVYMRLDEKAVTMAQPQKMWSGIHAWAMGAAILMSLMLIKLRWLVGWFLVHPLS